ncbi:MAG: sugar phosphate isomerase/epimerase [Treponema sp.]|nr:sugar phosphate isomerase/epimerase [Treponema sp.]
MKTGVQLYTVREYAKDPEGIEATLRKVKTMGFDVIQISGLGPCDIDLLAGWVNELGLYVCCTHNPWNRLAAHDELKKIITEHKKLGCPVIGLGMKPDIYPDSYEGYTRFIKKINEICKIVQDEGLTFAYHNHDLEFEKFNGITAMDRMTEECPHLEIILDIFWVQAGGINPSKYLEKLYKRINIVHLKDFRISGRTRQFAEIGEGNLDWAEIFFLCEKLNIPYAVIEQDTNFLNNPFDSLALSKKFIVEHGYWK